MKILTRVLCLLLLVTHLALAQMPQANRLKQWLKEHPQPDTLRINRLNELAWVIRGEQVEEVKALAQEALNLATQHHFAKGQSLALTVLSLLYTRTGEGEQALRCARQALAPPNLAPAVVAKTYSALSFYYLRQGDFPQANKGCLKAIQFAKLARDYEVMTISWERLNKIGIIQGRYSQALTYGFQALKAAQNSGELKNISRAFGSVSAAYRAVRDYDQALSYGLKSLSTAQRSGSTHDIRIALNILGVIYRDMKNYPQAIHYFEQDYRLCQQVHDISDLNIALQSLADAYGKAGEYVKSLAAGRQALAYFESSRERGNIAITQRVLALAFLHTNQPDSAMNHGLQSLRLAREIGDKKVIEESCRALTQIYARQKNYAEAFRYQTLGLHYQDSLSNDEVTRRAAAIGYTQELENQRFQIALLHKDQQLQAVDAANQRRVLYSLVAGLGLLSLLGLLLLRSNRLQQRTNVLLGQQFALSQEQQQHDSKLQHLEAEKLHELDGLRSRFFANVSHEFRTPLTLILGPLDQLLATAAEPTQQALHRLMQRNARRLLHLINQLLDLSKLEAGSLKLETQPGQPIEFLKLLAASFAPLAESRRVDFRTHFPEPDCVALFDEDKLEKIVVNLLSNACKFTPDGGSITLRVALIPEANREGTHLLAVTVADNGIGIEQQQLERVFDRFYQADNAHPHRRDSSGIGLALTKELVELHQGRIQVESQAGQGAAFTVYLPLVLTSQPVGSVAAGLNRSLAGGHHAMDWQIPEAATNGQQASQASPEREALPLLLVVEDNAELLGFLALQLRAHYRVVTAENGRQGLQKAFETIPDLIISDVMMPEMDGLALCQQLKQDERTSHIPLVLLTAKADGESRLEGLETGADDYLTKPFSGPELLVRVRNLIEQRKRLRERFGRQLTLKPAELAITSADEKFLQRVIAVVVAHIDEEDFSLDAFEKEMGLSHVQFYRKLKALTNLAPGEFLRHFRLQQGAMLLRGRHGNVSEVAYAVGFSSLAYFTRCFKEYYGQSPSDYVASQAVAPPPTVAGLGG